MPAGDANSQNEIKQGRIYEDSTDIILTAKVRHLSVITRSLLTNDREGVARIGHYTFAIADEDFREKI